MAKDLKYGEVQLERGDIGKDEPVFIFRAQDQLAPLVLEFYRGLAKRMGCPEVHLNNIEKNQDTFVEWQLHNFTKMPESANGEV